MPINYIICSAGEGSRMNKFGTSSKASLTLKGRSLLERSLDSLPIMSQDKIIIVVQKKHDLKEKFEHRLQSRYCFNDIVFVELEELTRGQLETVYLAKKQCNLNYSIGIFNCDTYFESSNLQSLMSDESIEGIIPCSIEPGDSWSFCQVDKELRVVAIEEKKRISEYASVGFYYFRDANKFFKRVKSYIGMENSIQELYVAPFYKEYLKENEKICIDLISHFKPMGSMEQLLNYWNISKDDFRQENPKGTLVVDLDNTITVEEKHIPYAEKKANLEVIKRLHEYKMQGFRIIIHTSRRMKTYDNNEAYVVANIASITLDWLKRYNVPFDGIKFGKPFAENAFYVDDKAIRPTEFVHKDFSELMEQTLDV